MHRLFRLCSLLLFSALVACSNLQESYPANAVESGVSAGKDAGDLAVQVPQQGSLIELTDVSDAATVAAARQQAAAIVGQRQMVYRGELSLEVPRPEDAVQAVVQRLQEWGGYLQQQAGPSLTIRVPAGRFDAVFASIRSMGRLLAEVRSADDVTEEYLDLGLRIENAKRSLERLRELLQRTDKVEDLLRVEQEMRRLSEEVERLEGRRRFLASQVAMATLKVSFRAASAPPDQLRYRQPSRFPWLNAIGPEQLLEGM